MSSVAVKLPPNPPVPPWVTDPGQRWVTVDEYAPVVGRSLRTVRWWCLEGVLADFGIQTYQDLRGRWWVRLQ